MWISTRATVSDAPAADLPLAPNTIRNGDTYALSIDVYSAGTGNVSATLVLQASGGTVSFTTPVTALRSNRWVTARGNVTLAWSGVLSRATLVLTTTNVSTDLLIQNPTVTDASFGPSGYGLDQCLLSPTVNPFGTPNAQGIYIIDCANNPLTIQNCRIVGTLVVLNAPGAGITINGPISWEPRLANYPALLTAASISLNVNGSVALSESTLGLNLNPVGTPYPYVGGSANATASDGLPSVLQGVIYSGADVSVTLSPTICGSLIAAKGIAINGSGGGSSGTATLNMTYSNAAFTIPPPGFGTGQAGVTPMPGSWNRVTQQ